jgi:hypothetical protein
MVVGLSSLCYADDSEYSRAAVRVPSAESAQRHARAVEEDMVDRSVTNAGPEVEYGYNEGTGDSGVHHVKAPHTKKKSGTSAVDVDAYSGDGFVDAGYDVNADGDADCALDW